MTKTILRLILSGILLFVTGVLVLLASLLTPVFFRVYPDFSRAAIRVLAGLTSVVPIAVCELLLVAIVLWLLISLVRAIVRRRVVRWLAGLLLTVSLAVTLFVALWGLNYYAPPMQERLGLPSRQYSKQELIEAACYYRDRANELAPSVERDETGAMLPGDFQTLAEAAGEGYEALADSYACFDGSTVRVKRLLSSKLQGKVGYTGVFICFTGESCVSTTTYAASLPFTMCHEIGHRMAFAREDEANFAGFLACEASSRPEFRYSGYYTAFRYCYNALYDADPSAAATVWSGVSPEVAADCNASARHYEAMRNDTAAEVSDKVYDTYLKSFSVESGLQSYGEVTDLLLAWYYSVR